VKANENEIASGSLTVPGTTVVQPLESVMVTS